MDYSWLDRLPKIDKENISEPAKYWALYARSFYENFLGLINNHRRLKKATVRKLEQLTNQEAKDALLFFYRIRRDELDGIPLWESLKNKYIRKLNESPDMIEADNLKEVKPGTDYLGLDEFQFPFGYYKGKMRVGKLRGIHPDIYNYYPDMQGFKGRMNMEYSGRAWIYDKIISIWDYPPSKEKLLEIIKDVEEEFREKFKQPLYINPNDWYIEVIDKKLGRKKFSLLQFKDWDTAERAKLIKIKDYKGSGEWDEEKKNIPHILSPMMKKETPKKGFGSANPKYLGKAKEKRYMYAEGYVYESLDEFLNEELGTLKKFQLPQYLIDKIIRGPGGWTAERAGRESDVEEIENPGDYKNLLKTLKDPFNSGIISVDGIAKYFFYRESERKFKLYDIEEIRNHEEQKLQRKREREEREKQRRLEIETQNENLNERRFHNYDPGDKGNYSTQGLAEFIKNLEGDVKVELIRSDEKREEKMKSRYEKRTSEIDPLEQPRSGYTRDISKSQKERFKKYSAKKKIKVAKDLQEAKENLKKQIVDNLDKALEEIIDDVKRGYTFNISRDHMGKEIMSNVNLKEISELAELYSALKAEYGASMDPVEVSKLMKRKKS